MEKDNLINETHIKNNTQKYKINKGFICIFMLNIITISLQSLLLYNTIILEKEVQAKLQSVNISHINDYINKIETIVDYVCNLYIEC
jgi:hypothetical protein